MASSGRRLGGRVVALALLAVLGGCGADRHRPVPFAGFGEVAFRVEPGSREWCALLAASERQRAQGLMGRHDLGGFDGMLFEFGQDTDDRFWMRRTPLPLSIAWIDGDGRVVSTADMAPCGDRDDCPRYAAAGPYRDALEVPRGGLRRLGLDRPRARLVPLDHRC